MTEGQVVEETPMDTEGLNNEDYVDAQPGGHVSPESFQDEIDIELDENDPEDSILNDGDGSLPGQTSTDIVPETVRSDSDDWERTACESFRRSDAVLISGLLFADLKLRKQTGSVRN